MRGRNTKATSSTEAFETEASLNRCSAKRTCWYRAGDVGAGTIIGAAVVVVHRSPGTTCCGIHVALIADTGGDWQLYKRHHTVSRFADWIFHPHSAIWEEHNIPSLTRHIMRNTAWLPAQ